jgi:hypothetical protein
MRKKIDWTKIGNFESAKAADEFLKKTNTTTVKSNKDRGSEEKHFHLGVTSVALLRNIDYGNI